MAQSGTEPMCILKPASLVKLLEMVSAHQITGELNRANLSNTGCICHHWWAAVCFLKLCADAAQSFQQLRALGKKEKPARAVELYNRCLNHTQLQQRDIMFWYFATSARSVLRVEVNWVLYTWMSVPLMILVICKSFK